MHQPTQPSSQLRRIVLTGSLALASLSASAATTLTIAALNNPDMIELKKLAPAFEQQNPDIKLNWVVLEENVLRQRVTTDIATKGGQFDVMTIGMYETPIWGKKGWLVPLTGVTTPFTSTLWNPRTSSTWQVVVPPAPRSVRTYELPPR